MQTEPKDTLSTSLSTENNHNSNSGEPPITGNYTIGMEDMNTEGGKTHLVKTKPLPGTPFHILYREGIGYALTVGNSLITTPMESEQELLMYVDSNAWNITTSLIIVMIEKMKKIQEDRG